jgi:N-acetylglucosaminyldiphosphoundecaprenol N-acetyl-beta-D-mannosaminyltransferase
VSELTWVWGVPFSPFSLREAADEAIRLIEAGRPSFIITANTHYVMLTHERSDLREVNAHAAFLVADGAPLVWASRWRGRGTPLPERVAGSDLIYELCARAAKRGDRLYFLGGGEGIAVEAARRLQERYPGLQVVGTESPPFRELTPEEFGQLKDRIRAARTDILILAFTMPRGEQWLAAHLAEVGVPLGINLGASIDFAAGRIRRAPRWMQRIGLEWAFRLWLEPRRLATRYARNAGFLLRMVARDLTGRREGEPSTNPAPAANAPSTESIRS